MTGDCTQLSKWFHPTLYMPTHRILAHPSECQNVQSKMNCPCNHHSRSHTGRDIFHISIFKKLAAGLRVRFVPKADWLTGCFRSYHSASDYSICCSPSNSVKLHLTIIHIIYQASHNEYTSHQAAVAHNRRLPTRQPSGS